MRARIVKPGLFSDFGLSRLPVDARYLFIGLWCIADREGRLIDSPRFIAGQVFPHDASGIEADVVRWLAQLEAGGFIQRYEVNGGRYILVTNFKKHQQINHREAASNLPAPPRQRAGNEKAAIEQPVDEPTRLPVDFSRVMPGKCPGNARVMPGPNGSGIRSGSGISGVYKLPYTPLTPHESSPPPLVPVENSVEISLESPAASQLPSSESPPREQNQAIVSSRSPAETAADAAGLAVNEPQQGMHALTGRMHLAIAQKPNPHKISSANTGIQRVGDFAAEVARRMLRDWMERHADRLPPPDDEICQRLLVAHGMSLDRLRDWLLDLRRRGKRPESVQSWGWFAYLAEAEATRHRPGRAARAATGGAA